MRYLALLLFVGLPFLAYSQDERSLSPYFLIYLDSGEAVPDFPLHSTSAEVEIAGVIADVTITQVYTNHSTRPIEAVYVFPGSTNAAVYAMEMQVGRRTITAEIRERVQARTEYDSAKAQGKTASLLEQERPNVFTMNVANIMPGDSIIVRMSYTERLVPTDGTYEFVYPTVVAPRYSREGISVPLADLNGGIGNQVEGVPYSPAGVAPSYKFNIRINLASAIPFEFVKSTTHKVLLSFAGKNEAKIILDPSESNGGNRDYILQYRFAGGKIETGLMLYEGKDENFFMLMMQPPARVPVDSIPPREYIFVMDVSGSMFGYPLETSKALLKNLVGGLRPTDKFNIVQFAGGASLFADHSMFATTENVDSAMNFLSVARGGGGTELNHAMKTAMAIPLSEGFSRSIVIATDGLITAEAQVYRSMRNQLDSANVFAFGIGSSCNRYLIEGIAFTGGGEPFVVTKDSEADSAAERFRRYISSPVLTDISVRYDGFDAYDVEPVAVPDLFAERPLVITGKYRGKASGKIVVDGMTGAGAYHKELRVDSVKPSKKNKSIRLLWARDRVKYLSYLDKPGGYFSNPATDSATINQILDLGLKYGILTNYTSFVAIDRRERNKEGIEDSTIQQVLPMPQGMPNTAIGLTPNLMGAISTYSYTSISVDANYCMVSAMPLAILTPIRPEWPRSTMITQDPVLAGDINWFYNGNYTNPVLTNNYSNMFNPGISGSILGRLPGEMMNSYSIATRTYNLSGDLFSPTNFGALNLNSWWYGDRLTLSGTSRGNQFLHFAHVFKVDEAKNRRASIEITEQWNPIATDLNNDDHIDVPVGIATYAHAYTRRWSDGTKSGFTSMDNDVLFHWSSMEYGQDSGSFDIKDKAIAFAYYPKAEFRLSESSDLFVSGNFGYANVGNQYGVNRFYNETSIAGLQTKYERRYSTSVLDCGAKGEFSSGAESFNDISTDQRYNSAGVFVSFEWTKNRFVLRTSLHGEYDDINGAIVIPQVRMKWENDKLKIAAQGNRYRSTPFAAGRLMPLFYSSRDLMIDNPRADQGWKTSVDANYYWAYRYWIRASYICIFPERSVIVNTDYNENMISVYNVTGGKPLHRMLVGLNFDLTEWMTLKADYFATFFGFNYGEGFFQQPLLAKHRASATMQFTLLQSRMNITGQVCFTGKQRLPLHNWSPAYATANLFIRYRLREKIEIFLSGFNLLDYRQTLTILETGTPGQFDGWMIWAPRTGFTAQFGVAMKF